MDDQHPSLLSVGYTWFTFRLIGEEMQICQWYDTDRFHVTPWPWYHPVSCVPLPKKKKKRICSSNVLVHRSNCDSMQNVIYFVHYEREWSRETRWSVRPIGITIVETAKRDELDGRYNSRRSTGSTLAALFNINSRCAVLIYSHEALIASRANDQPRHAYVSHTCVCSCHP